MCSRTKIKKNLIKIKAYCVMDYMNFDLYNVLKKNRLNSLNLSVPSLRCILM